MVRGTRVPRVYTQARKIVDARERSFSPWQSSVDYESKHEETKANKTNTDNNKTACTKGVSLQKV